MGPLKESPRVEVLKVHCYQGLHYGWYLKVYHVNLKLSLNSLKKNTNFTILQTYATSVTFALMLRKGSNWRNAQPSAQLERKNARLPLLVAGTSAQNVVSLSDQLQFVILFLVKLITPSELQPFVWLSISNNVLLKKSSAMLFLG